MKKLLVTVIGAAAAYGASAGLISTQRFESATISGDAVSISNLNTLAGGEYWSDGGSTNNVYKIGGVSELGGIASQPTPLGTPAKALDVATRFGEPLTVKIDSDGEDIGSGLYFDSLVKFTACDSEPEDRAAYDGAKIMMWLQTNDDETETYLKVKAGYLSFGSKVGVTNKTYTCEVPAGFDASKFNRVTIKAIRDITTEGLVVPAFAIYINGKTDGSEAQLVSCSEDKWDNTFTKELTEAAADLNSALKKGLFPSMVQSGTKDTLVSVGFDGTGAMTDLAFTDVAPTFAEDYAEDKADVNGDKFKTLAEAVASLNGKNADSPTTVTLTLNKGINFEGPLTVNNTNLNIEVVIDLNGLAITNTAQSGYAIICKSPVTITDSSANKTGAIVSDLLGEGNGAIYVDNDEGGALTLEAGTIDGYIDGGEDYVGAVTLNGGTVKQDPEGMTIAEGYKAEARGETGFYDIVEDTGTVITIAAHPWYENPKAVVLAENLPGQTGNIVSAFHGQGEGEYLGLTYSTNPQQFDLFKVDGTEAPTKVISVAAADATNPGFRGVAISKTLGIAMTLAYATNTTMYAYPLAGGTPTAVTKPITHSFDAAAFSPDGNYLFSNALNGESSNQFYVKWSVAVDAETGALSLTKVGSISAGGRGRSMAYARINERDIVFALADTGKVVAIDMTGDTASAWSAKDLITDLPAHSYGTLCVSGNVGEATPKLTVATSTNNGATKGDVLNVYALTVPASGDVKQTLVKSFDEDALTVAGFGDISDANRYGNTVYVTEDDATIYFARPDNKLYAAEVDVWAILLDEAVNGAYEIDNLDELKAFQENVGTLKTAGKTFKLTADIALDAAWPGIGLQNGKDVYKTDTFNAKAFCGTFDGQNHTISGFQMVGVAGNPDSDKEGLDYCGFFNSTYGATIQNLKIQYAGSLFAADTTASTKESGATFVGVAKNSTLRNLTTVAGTVSCSKGFGGIVGYLTLGTTVESCTNNVNMTSLQPNKCGGIAMITQQDGVAVTNVIRNCQNNGTTTGSAEHGGLVGYVQAPLIIDGCESTVADQLLNHYSQTIIVQGVNKANANSVSYIKHSGQTPADFDGLHFATVNGNTATFVYDGDLAAGNTYKVMFADATATYNFTAAGTIVFDESLTSAATYSITADQGFKVTEATVGTTKTFTATAKEYYTAISLNKATTSIVTNETETLVATLTPASAADDSVTWTTSDATVATVDQNGVVTAVAAGEATITVTATHDSSVTASCTVTVTAPSVGPAPIAPGEQSSTTYTDQAAAEAAAAASPIAVPDAVAKVITDSTAQEAYKALFKAKAVPAGEGQYKVVVDLKPEIETEIQTAVDTANTTTLGAVLAAETDTANVSVTTKAGLYYQIVTGDSLPLPAPAADKWVMATGTSETIQVTKPEGDAAFFKVYCSPTK